MSISAASSVDVASQHDTVRVGDIEMDRLPVTNARYEEFVAATGHRAPAYWPNGHFPRSLADHPVVGVDFFDAIAFSLWAGGTLPTELEWVMGTGLEEQRAYVWGDLFDSSRCNTVRSGWKGTSPVEAFPEGVAPSGCVDMCGNVWEMTCNGFPGDNESVIVKGGSWYDYPAHARIDTQFRARVHKAGNTIGFRLVYHRGLRLPPFIDRDLAAQCIVFRQEAGVPASEELPESGEWNEIVMELRKEAAVCLPAIQEPIVEQAGSVEKLLEFFDEADKAPLEIPLREALKKKSGPGILGRVQTYVSERRNAPLVFLGVAAVAMTSIFWALWGDPVPVREVALREARPRARVARVRPAPLETRRKPVRAVADSGPAVARDDGDRASRVGDSIELIESGDWKAREAEERFLMARPHAYERILMALDTDMRADARASLRYVVAALEETRRPSRVRPRAVRQAPQSGLVLLFKNMSADVFEAIATVRRTAKAERLRATVVYTGPGSGERILKAYAPVLRDVDFYADRRQSFARRLGAVGQTAVAGLDRNGKVAFVKVGWMPRAELAEKTHELAMDR